MASLGAVLEQYPNEVITYITDPRTGVQRNCKWPPTISEIVEACDNRITDLKRKERFENWGKNDPLLLEGPQIERPTLEELQAKYGKDWGLTAGETINPSAFKAPSWDAITSNYQADPSKLARLINAKDS